jgi:PEP-CTERM motif
MKVKRARLATIALGCVFFTTTARAQLELTLSDLVQSPGATITANDKLFSNFQIVSSTTTGGGIVNLDQIQVVPLVNDPLNPGLRFNAPIGALGTPFGHAGPATASLTFAFDVQTTSGLPLIKDNSLLLNGFTIDAGPLALIRISEQVQNATGGALGFKQVLGVSGEQPNSGNPNHFDTTDFVPTAFVHVIKSIEILGPGDNDGAFLTMFEQRFSQVPEPSSLALLMTCAACIARRGRATHRSSVARR